MRPNLALLTALLAAGRASAQAGGPYDLTWSTIDGGGAVFSSGGVYSIGGTIGQPDAGPPRTGGAFAVAGGFWTDAGGTCYANCDESTTPPVLNVLDFSCFINAFAAAEDTANCDGSTTPPVLNVLDFSCFINRFAAGCS